MAVSRSSNPIGVWRYMLTSLLAGCALSCSSETTEQVGASESAIVNGSEMIGNDFGWVGMTIVDSGNNLGGFVCSGSLFKIGGQQAVLTAAHCVEPSPGGGFEVEFLDPASFTHESVFSHKVVVHPAYIGPPASFVSPDGDLSRFRSITGKGVDLALVLLDAPFLTDDFLVPEIGGTPAAAVLQKSVTIVGAGVTGPVPAGFMDVTISGLRTLTQIGRVTRTVGSNLVASVGQNPNTHQSQKTEPGDSGGPWLVNVNDVKTLVGVTSGGARTGFPNGGFAASLIDDLAWVQFGTELNAKGGSIVEGAIDDGGLEDQIFVSNRQGTDAILVVTGEGLRIQKSVARPTGFGDGELKGTVIGQFNGSTPNKDPRDLVGIANGALVAIFDPISNPSSAGFVSLTPGGQYQRIIKKRCNADAWEDVVAFLPSTGMLPKVDVYYGSENGLVGPKSDLNAVQCVFSVPNPLRDTTSSSEGSCRAGNSALANTCGARMGNSGSCWCSAECGGSHPCCGDVDEVCGSGSDFKTDAAVATVVGQESQHWSEGGFNNDQPVFTVDLPATDTPHALAIPITPEWLLTWTGGMQPQNLKFQGSLVMGSSTLAHPDANLALIHLAPGSAPAAGLGSANAKFYAGTADLLQEETTNDTSSEPVVFRTLAKSRSTGEVTPVTIPPTALYLNPQSSAITAKRIALGDDPVGSDDGMFGTEPASLAFLEVPTQPAPFDLLPGSPIFSPLNQLIGITGKSKPHTLGLLNVSGGEATGDREVPYVIHPQTPLYRTNATADDVSQSARYWIEQTITRSAVRDFNSDRRQDLVAGSVLPTNLGSFLLSYAVSLEGNVLSPTPSSFFSVTTASAGDWKFVGAAKLGEKSTGIVWSQPDSGELQIWRLNGQVIDGVVRGVVPPTWEISALGDIDGDNITDLIWTNSTTGRGFYWIMKSIDEHSAAKLNGASDPSFLVREFNHFPAQMLVDDSGEPAFELVAADHFEVSPDDKLTNPVLGPEQAAVDLVWAEIDGGGALVWPMTYLFRSCDEIDDPITNEYCESLGGGYVRTYELARPVRSVRMTSDLPETFRPTGTGDFNDDGRVDIVFNDQGTGATSGQIEIAYGLSDGTFDAELVVDEDAAPVIQDPEFVQIK